VDFKELKELISIFEESELSEIEIEEDGSRMRLQKHNPNSSGMMPQMVYSSGAPQQADASAPAPAPAEEAPAEVTYAHTIDSPMVGTFYVASGPGEPPFAQEGDQITEGTTVCIVEAMKLMNEVSAKSNCVIEKVLIENGQPVEFGQPLFAIRKLA
jgi:acetyl-CoA carboxylase biotin carboxyl carrier protein